MDSLKVTFVNGEELSFAISPESTLSIETPDGVNGVQRGVVSEVANVEYVKAVADAPAEVAVPDAAVVVDAPAVEVAPDPSLLQKVEASLGLGAPDDTKTSETPDETPDQGDTAA